jgi:hypothetical protein
MISLSWLTTAGNHILSADGTPVVLRGINRSGLEYAHPIAGDFLAGARLSFDEIEEIVRGWGARVVRVPFAQSRLLEPTTSAAYLHALDTVVDWVASCGAYTLLDLQWLDPVIAYGRTSDGSLNRIAPLPSPGSCDVWRLLAERYQSNPAVLFDIYNEPHSRLPGDSHVPTAVRHDGSEYSLVDGRVTARVWREVAARLVRTIKRVHPRALVFVSGVSWGYDLRGVPFESRSPNRTRRHRLRHPRLSVEHVRTRRRTCRKRAACMGSRIRRLGGARARLRHGVRRGGGARRVGEPAARLPGGARHRLARVELERLATPRNG